MRQVYALVLGLDVLGNPYALISGIGEGVKDLFYEPYQVFWNIYSKAYVKLDNNVLAFWAFTFKV